MENVPVSLPKVSVIVCTYNGGAYLDQQLTSLVEQDYPQLEIIISDDCSTDNTLHIAERFASADNRVRVYKNAVNLGYNANFAHAFTLASGDFIAVSDQDDVWKKEKIGEMMKLFSTPDVLLAHCQSIRFSGEIPEAAHYTARYPLEGNDVRKTLFFNTIAGHNIIFKKQLLNKITHFPEDVFYDWWLVINAAIHGKVAATSKVLTFHREHASNVTLGKKDEGKQTRKKADERKRTLQEVIKLNALKEPDQRFAKELLSSLESLNGKKFSMKLFRFLFTHAATLFFFKKKKWPSVSHLKIAFRHSFAI